MRASNCSTPSCGRGARAWGRSWPPCALSSSATACPWLFIRIAPIGPCTPRPRGAPPTAASRPRWAEPWPGWGSSTSWAIPRKRAAGVRTLQDRLVNELRVAGIGTVGAANRYLRTRFLPAFNAEFARPPAEPASAFVPLGRVDLDQILCLEESRVVGRDNVVTTGGIPLPLTKQPGRRTCAGLRVVVRRHLNGHHSVWYGTRCLGSFTPHGHPVRAA